MRGKTTTMKWGNESVLREERVVKRGFVRLLCVLESVECANPSCGFRSEPNRIAMSEKLWHLMQPPAIMLLTTTNKQAFLSEKYGINHL